MSLQQAHSGRESTGGNNVVRVMVVDDSAVVRGLVSRWVDEDPVLVMVGKAANGQLAIDNLQKYDPDVLILDIEMPVLDGMRALPELLRLKPDLKVVMASTLTRRNAEISLKALSLGAIDYIPKPEGNSGVTTSSTFREDLIRKIKAVSGFQDMTPRAAAARAYTPEAKADPLPQPVPGAAITLRPFSNVRPRILAIGSSTGGPRALAELFAAIAPIIRSIPVVITQHMPPTFTTILAEHLGKETGAPSKEGEDGEPLRAGAIYVAPGGKHMALEEKGGGVAIKVYEGPPINYCKPAVDPLFQSVANIFGASTLGVVLTGMGNDGARGALEIAKAGGSVIAQDQATSVVWGMPGAAAAAGACAAVLPIDQIGANIAALIGKGSPS